LPRMVEHEVVDVADHFARSVLHLGTEEHVRSTRLVGHSLSFEGALVHASAFALAA
jgi:hypothetical protein